MRTFQRFNAIDSKFNKNRNNLFEIETKLKAKLTFFSILTFLAKKKIQKT